MRRLTLPLPIAVASLALTGCGAFAPAPSTTVTVTATPSAEPTTLAFEATTQAPTEAAPAELATAETEPDGSQPASTQAPAWDPGHKGPSVSVDDYLRAELPHLYNSDSPIAKIGVEDDDVIVDYKIPMYAHATENYAPATVKEIAAVLRQHTDDPNIAALDLVAVRTSDGVTAAMEQVTPHPQCAGC